MGHLPVLVPRQVFVLNPAAISAFISVRGPRSPDIVLGTTRHRMTISLSPCPTTAPGTSPRQKCQPPTPNRQHAAPIVEDVQMRHTQEAPTSMAWPTVSQFSHSRNTRLLSSFVSRPTRLTHFFSGSLGDFFFVMCSVVLQA
jgi:hypothetical protein